MRKIQQGINVAIVPLGYIRIANDYVARHCRDIGASLFYSPQMALNSLSAESENVRSSAIVVCDRVWHLQYVSEVFIEECLKSANAPTTAGIAAVNAVCRAVITTNAESAWNRAFRWLAAGFFFRRGNRSTLPFCGNSFTNPSYERFLRSPECRGSPIVRKYLPKCIQLLLRIGQSDEWPREERGFAILSLNAWMGGAAVIDNYIEKVVAEFVKGTVNVNLEELPFTNDLPITRSLFLAATNRLRKTVHYGHS